MNSPQ